MKNNLQLNLLRLLFLFIGIVGFNQKAMAQSLAKGDIAFTSFNADEDGFSIVTFVALPANTIIYFTDNEATGATAFNSGEAYHQWNTGAAVIPAGTVVRFSAVDVTSLAASVGTLTRATVSGNTNYGISTSGDILYAFIGTSASAPTTILTAISSGDTVSPGDPITNAGLTTGTNAIVIRTSADYGEYNGSRTGQSSFANYKSLVFNVANWTVDQNDGNYATTVPNTTAFTLAAAIPTVSLSANTNTGTEAGTTVITLTATASSAVSGNQTLTIAASGTNITSGDYALSSTTITIPSGQTTGSVTFTIVDDATAEGSEIAVLTLSNPSSGITLGTAISQNIAITDNDIVAAPSIDLSTYVRVGRYDLPEPTRTAHPANSLLAQEVSAVTYNWDTNTLFVVGDGSTSIVQVSKTGQLIDSMTLAQGSSPQGTEFYDTEGLTYIGNGQFVMSEERDRQVVLFTYAAGTTLTRANTQTVKLGTFVNNIGTEGLSFDPITNGYIVLKETQPMGIFQTGINFAAGTATNGSATTENSINLFDPALTGLLDFADVFALSNIPALNGQPLYNNLLVLSQESAKIVNIDRNGNIANTLTIVSDAGNPLDVASQQHEGLTMDRDGILYVTSENGGGDIDHPQLWVYAPSTTPNQAPTAVTLNNTTTSILENTSTATAIKVAEIVVTDDGLGTNNITLSGADASFFQVTGTGLYIKAGTVLDYETKTSYSVTVNVDDTTLGNTPDATTSFTLNVIDVTNESGPATSLIISEIAPWSSSNGSTIAADWFELTNTGATTIDLTGWKMDDNSNAYATAVPLSGITSIAPGESVIFLESTASNPAATIIPNFKSVWFGANAPASLQIGTYQGSGVGLSSGGDAVNIYDNNGTLKANIVFGPSPAGPFKTFNNAAGLNNTTTSLLSEVGINDAFVAVNDANEIGSPGLVGHLFISEVAPWASSNSPVGVDWFEVTNSKAVAVDITGWKMDDNSQSPVAAVALSGITSINPGESVIFMETNDLAGKTTTFLNTWFGTNPSSSLRIGNYNGSGVGLGTGGDQVNLYNATNVLQSTVIFGTSPTTTFATFDNAAGANNVTISQLSAVGVNGAFIAANSPSEIGSPGTILTSPCPTITATATPASASVCSGATTTVTVAATGGTLPYTITGSPLTVGGGTYNYTVTDAKGCATTAAVTVTTTPNTTNTTTITACDSYVWTVNNQAYTTSGTYTFVSGCHTETLALTITPSSIHTTTASACDTYTWNGQTYTVSGIYTGTTTNCITEKLDLTITPSTTNTTTISACDTYTWPANGQVYTTSGNYTIVNGCHTENLNLTINSGTITSQPAATYICSTVGSSTDFSVASTMPNATYSWQYRVVTTANPDPAWITITTANAAVYAGYTTATLTVTKTAKFPATGTQYRVLVSGDCGSIASDAAAVTILSTAKPGTIASAASVCINGDITFTLSKYAGTSFQWQSAANATSEFTNIEGATETSYTLTNAAIDSNKSYRVVVTNACSNTSAVSAIKTIKIDPASVAGSITTAGGVVCAGSAVSLKLTGNAGKVQWEYATDGVNFSNAPKAADGQTQPFGTTSANSTATAYAVTGITADLYFRAKVTSGACSVAYTAPVHYTIGTVAQVGTITPANTTVCPRTGTTLVLSNAIGTVTWQKATNLTAPNWVSTTNHTLTYDTGSLSASTIYRAMVTIGACSTVYSDIAYVTVMAKPVAKTITANATTPSGKTAAAAICTSDASKILTIGTGYVGAIQWQASTTSTTSGFIDIDGANDPSYTVTNPAVGANYFRAKFTNACGVEVLGTAVTVYFKECAVAKATITAPFDATAYPNPYSDSFNLNISTSNKAAVTVATYDMVGKLIDKREVNPSEMETLQLGNQYPAGVYNVVIAQDGETKALRVVKR